MCGRFALTSKTSDIENLLPELKASEEIKPRYNIAPTQNIKAVINDGKIELINLRWGLIPSWAKDESIGSKMINARAETLFEKPAFRNLIKKRRCLIFANAFYEWKAGQDKKNKVPYLIKLKSGKPFAFAGLWDVWRNPERDITISGTIITTSPNSLMEQIHNRMPVILKPEAYLDWLGNVNDENWISKQFQPYREEDMEAYPVSPIVNNPANDFIDCMKPIV